MLSSPSPRSPNLPAMEGNKNTISSNKGQNQIMNKSSSSLISAWQRETDVILRPSISAVKDEFDVLMWDECESYPYIEI